MFKGARKWSGVGAVLCVGAVLVGADGARADVPEPWTQYQGNAAHSGYVPGTIDPASIVPLWSASAASLGYESLAKGVAIDAGRVYVTAATTNASGGSSSAVFALGSGEGAVQWSRTISIDWWGGLSAPAIGNGMVYADRLGESNVSGAILPAVYGFAASDGHQTFATTYQGQSNVGGQPTVAGTTLYLNAGTYGGFASYNARTGAPTGSAYLPFQGGWTAAADASHAYVYLPAAGQQPGPLTGTLYVITPSATTTIENPPDYYVALDQTSNVALGSQGDALVITGSYGYGSGFGFGPWQLVSFEPAGGSVRWRTNLAYSAYSFGTFLARDTGKLAVANGTVYADNGGQLSLFSEATGAHLADWAAPAGEKLYGNPIVTDNLIFAQTDLATYAIDASTLQTVWSTPVTGEIAVGGNRLVIDSGGAIAVYAVPEPALAAGVIVAGAWTALAGRRRGRRGRCRASGGCGAR